MEEWEVLLKMVVEADFEVVGREDDLVEHQFLMLEVVDQELQKEVEHHDVEVPKLQHSHQGMAMTYLRVEANYLTIKTESKFTPVSLFKYTSLM